VEVVEVTSHLPSGLVVGSDLPAFKLGYLLGEGGLLDGSRYPKVLLDALALTYLLREILHCRTIVNYAPLLGDLAVRYAVDEDTYFGFLLPGRGMPMTSPRMTKLCLYLVTTVSPSAICSSMVKLVTG
jgi:hypothetical protein